MSWRASKSALVYGGLKMGERPTRSFFKLEHERVARNSVPSILDSNDVEVFFSRRDRARSRAFLFRSFF